MVEDLVLIPMEGNLGEEMQLGKYVMSQVHVVLSTWWNENKAEVREAGE